jgi:hypothetical protein
MHVSIAATTALGVLRLLSPMHFPASYTDANYTVH